MRIGGSTAVAGVVGRPVTGSLSPAIHNAWLAAAGLDGVYVPLDVADAAAFGHLVLGLRGGGSVRGLNVTAPFKEAALAAADRADAAAEAAGAANLLLFQPDGTVAARNTDGIGLLFALRTQAGLEVRGVVATILGAGGASRGAAATLVEAGAAEVRIVNRTPARAQLLAELLGPRVTSWSWEDVDAALTGADLLVNATTLGRDGGEPLDQSLQALPAEAVVMDMVYRPLQTPLLARAEASGRKPVDGLSMLIGQAVPSFEALFGRAPAPELDIRAVALGAVP
ncbi:MAG: shikimate dehydrogenase [Proteobacteria bacterium]|nr:shikimate dehydrogenase [Pseudomonadota bacterium]